MAEEKYNVDRPVVFTYAVKNFRSGRSDVTIIIYKSDGTNVLGSTVMTEIGTQGIYYYSWTPDTLGHYVAIMDCTAYPFKAYDEFEIVGYVPGAPTVGYTTADDIRNMTNLDSNDISDSELNNLITEAIKQLNRDINIQEIREEIDYIDNTRENEINGTNATYYIKNWERGFIADSDDDGNVDTGDIKVYQVDSNGTETTPTISSITPNDGKFVLSSAPTSGNSLYVTYEWAYVSEYTPDPLVKLACTFLTSAYAYTKINVGKAVQFSLGNLRFYRHIDSFNVYYNKYLDIVNQINNAMIYLKESEEIV